MSNIVALCIVFVFGVIIGMMITIILVGDKL